MGVWKKADVVCDPYPANAMKIVVVRTVGKRPIVEETEYDERRDGPWDGYVRDQRILAWAPKQVLLLSVCKEVNYGE